MSLYNTICPICNRAECSSLINFEKWRIERCQSCDLGILAPMPTTDELQKLYHEAYFDDQYDKGLPLDTDAFERRISQEHHRVKFFQTIKKQGTILDLGCGMGYFLYACRRFGYDVQGADISDFPGTYVRDELNIPLTVGGLDELDFQPATFDVVTMWHFLEHTSNPYTCLAKSIKWLKPGGLLVIDVPNYESTDAQHFWNDWVGWQIPFHLYHFNPKTLGRLLAGHNFKILRQKTYHSEYIKQRLGKIPLLKLLARPIAKCYSGTSVAVVAKRADS
jgi:2-polyprenyl-3-methyl-5-hydroxy-6-metoxy-1,4-benzoquinol methylase